MATIAKTWTLFESDIIGNGVSLPLSADKAGSEIGIQIYGDEGITFEGTFQARIFTDAGFEDIAAFNNKTMAMSPSFTAKGLYAISSGAFSEIRVNVTSVSGGMQIANVNQPTERLTLTIVGGRVEILDSCTDGQIDICGITPEAITDNSNGTTVIYDCAPASDVSVQAILQIVAQLSINDDGVLVRLDESSKQIIRDAMAKAPTATPELGSIDNTLNRVDENTQT